jgi:hypothetical protein
LQRFFVSKRIAATLVNLLASTTGKQGGGDLLLSEVVMALERTIRYLEKDIEDWFWENPHKIEWVDGWIDRQLQLQDNSILDLLGYRNYGNFINLIIVELKSNPLKIDDFFQLLNYEKQLIETVEATGLLCFNTQMFLVGTDEMISEAFLKNALLLNINLASIGLDDENNLGLSGQWHFTNGYYSEYQNNNKSLIKGGRLDKLIGFLLPRMDEMVKDMCEKEIVAKRGY